MPKSKKKDQKQNPSKAGKIRLMDLQPPKDPKGGRTPQTLECTFGVECPTQILRCT